MKKTIYGIAFVVGILSSYSHATDLLSEDDHKKVTRAAPTENPFDQFKDVATKTVRFYGGDVFNDQASLEERGHAFILLQLLHLWFLDPNSIGLDGGAMIANVARFGVQTSILYKFNQFMPQHESTKTKHLIRNGIFASHLIFDTTLSYLQYSGSDYYDPFWYFVFSTTPLMFWALYSVFQETSPKAKLS